MKEHVAIGTLMARHTAAYVEAQRGPVRYILIPLTSHQDRYLQDVLAAYVDGYDMYRRSQTFISTSGINDDALWETLCSA